MLVADCFLFCPVWVSTWSPSTWTFQHVLSKHLGCSCVTLFNRGYNVRAQLQLEENGRLRGNGAVVQDRWFQQRQHPQHAHQGAQAMVQSFAQQPGVQWNTGVSAQHAQVFLRQHAQDMTFQLWGCKADARLRSNAEILNYVSMLIFNEWAQQWNNYQREGSKTEMNQDDDW